MKRFRKITLNCYPSPQKLHNKQ